jgi:hypothetical protein
MPDATPTLSGKEVTTMLKHTLRYARYALTVITVVGRGGGEN